ncbi:M16 family metallopeptidase [Vibrio sinaloensis]|uniref:M16 family metallopeptidase n=1 Tax=Photobacterium sp. (strain ATCC 43367) TaxID=379097 RepID=UPI0035EB0C8F
MRILLLFISLILVGCTQPQVLKPIEPDTNWTQGQLENGVKYHIYPTDGNPVSLRLYVHVGSAQETDQQKGYAHFLEHMAFNGSRHFSSNDIVDMFEANGLTFGADINAYTSYYETVYKLDLPDNKKLDDGVMWLRDIGDGLTLSANEIEKEKGVIQGEIRRTRPEHKSLSEKYYDFLIKDTAVEGLDPVGNVDSVNGVSSESLRAFYTKWYQPQYSEVVITGDIDSDEAVALINKHFADWKASPSAGNNSVEKVTFALADYVDTIGEFDAPSLSLLINRAPSKIEQRKQLLDSWLDEISLQIIRQRLEAEYQSKALPLQSLAITPYYMNYQRNALLSVAFEKENRQKAQTIFVDSLTSLRDFGATQNELETSLAYYQQLITDLDYNWGQRDAVTFAEERAWAISVGQTSQSKLDYKQSLEELVNTTNLERINQQINHLLADDYVIVIGADKAEDIQQLQSRLSPIRNDIAQKGVAPAALIPTAAELAKPQQSGSIVNQTIDKYGHHIWTLSNGIEVMLETDFTTIDTVNIVYGSQGGKAALEPELYAASEMAIPVVIRSGVGDFNGTQFDSYLAKNNIEVFPFINFTHHGLEIGATKAKLADALKVIYNISTNINVDPRQIEAVQQETYANQQRYLATPYGKWERAINRNSYEKSSSHYSLSAPDYAMVNEPQIRQVHQELFAKNRGNKLVIVANITPEELTPLLQFYVASIPLDKASAPNYKVAYKAAPQTRVDLAEHNEQNSIYLLRVTNPSAQSTSAKTAFMDDMIQRLLAKKLTSYVREELGLDYAPDAYSASLDQEPSTDWLIEAQVAPQDVTKIEVAVDKVMADIVSDVSAKDFETVAKQLSTALTPLQDKPIDRTWFYARYWMHGYGIESLKDVNAMIDSITVQELKQRIDESFGGAANRSKYTLTPASGK